MREPSTCKLPRVITAVALTHCMASAFRKALWLGNLGLFCLERVQIKTETRPTAEAVEVDRWRNLRSLAGCGNRAKLVRHAPRGAVFFAQHDFAAGAASADLPKKPRALVGQHHVEWLALPRRANRHCARVGVEVGH